ncbi:hypothetical protein ACFVVU_08645 [Kitasatospora sp. NPDC057965]
MFEALDSGSARDAQGRIAIQRDTGHPARVGLTDGDYAVLDSWLRQPF